MRLYIVQVQQLEWPEEEEHEEQTGAVEEGGEKQGEQGGREAEKQEEEGSSSGSGRGGMAAGRAPRRRRHGVVYRVEPVPPSRYVRACVFCRGCWPVSPIMFKPLLPPLPSCRSN